MGQGNQSTSWMKRISPVLEADPPIASFGRRLAAAAVDHLIIWTVCLAVGRVLLGADFLYNQRSAGWLGAGGGAVLLLYSSLATFCGARRWASDW
jgi:hypothetical protein